MKFNRSGPVPRVSDSPPPTPPSTPASEAPPVPPPPPPSSPPSPRKRRRTFGEDFSRFFLRGLGTLLPTIITVGLIWWVVDFLWNSIGWYLILVIKRAWLLAVQQGWVDPTNAGYINRHFDEAWYTKPLGVLLALILIYLVGLLVGNFLGRAIYRAGEAIVLRIPLVRAVYPAVKQVTDFLLADRDAQFEGSGVVAVQAHNDGIWSVALVTGKGLPALTEATRREMVTVFVPSSPTAVSGYVMLAAREDVVELPMAVDEAMRLLVSGGVIVPKEGKGAKEPWTLPRPPRPARTARTAPGGSMAPPAGPSATPAAPSVTPPAASVTHP